MTQWSGRLLLIVLIAGGFTIPSGGAWSAAVAQNEAQDEPLRAAIYPGACVQPGEAVRAPLAPLEKPVGEVVRGLPWLSRTEIEMPLAALRADSYALVVAAGDDLLDTAVACGDLNPLTTPDGMVMVVGLFERQSSQTTGIAVLTAIGERTEVRVYVARALGGGYPFGSTDFGLAGSSNERDATTDDDGVAVGPDMEPDSGGDAVTTITVRVSDDALTID